MAGVALWAILLQTPLAVPLGLKTLADQYLEGCRAGEITSDLLTHTTLLNMQARSAMESKYNLAWNALGEQMRDEAVPILMRSAASETRESQLECPDPSQFGKIQTFHRTLESQVEWTDAYVLPSGADKPSDLKFYSDMIEIGKANIGPLGPGQSRMISVQVGDKSRVTLTTKLGGYRATYAVVLERGFLTVDIVHDGKNVYLADFHK